MSPLPRLRRGEAADLEFGLHYNTAVAGTDPVNLKAIARRLEQLGERSKPFLSCPNRALPHCLSSFGLDFLLGLASRLEASAMRLIPAKRASQSAATRAIERVAASSRSGRTA
jgi:hypothetical protein